MRLFHSSLFLLNLVTVTVVKSQDNGSAEILYPIPEKGWEYKDCQVYDFDDSSARGSEDVVAYKDGIFFVTAGMQGPNGGQEDRSNVTEPYTAGGIYLLNLSDTSSPAMEEATISSLPSGLNFRPHGAFYDSNSNRLLVVSHNEQEQEENVVIFTVDETEALPELLFQVALYSDDWVTEASNFAFWHINDLVVAGPDEFLATQWGPLDLSNPSPKAVWSCALEDAYDNVPEDGRIKTVCAPAIDFFSIAWNGIAITDTRDTAWVADTLASQLVQIQRNDDTRRNWTVSAIIPTPGLVDNIAYSDGALHLASPLRVMDPNAYVGSYLVATKPDEADATLQVEPVFQFDPAFLADVDFPFSTSSVYPIDELIVLGSTAYPGVIICSKDSKEMSLDVADGVAHYWPSVFSIIAGAAAMPILLSLN